ncbi:MAG TPA: hypothetical protein VK479_03180 [Micropepsaceae bacterium]|nr:hypothetical protein [Micropepsaceae bacterium]
MTTSETQIFDTRGKIRDDFTDDEIAELSALSGFAALIDASVENELAEKNMRDASANVGDHVRALSAAQAVLEKLVPRVSEYEAVRAHLKSLGR